MIQVKAPRPFGLEAFIFLWVREGVLIAPRHALPENALFVPLGAFQGLGLLGEPQSLFRVEAFDRDVDFLLAGLSELTGQFAQAGGAQPAHRSATPGAAVQIRDLFLLFSEQTLDVAAPAGIPFAAQHLAETRDVLFDDPAIQDISPSQPERLRATIRDGA